MAIYDYELRKALKARGIDPDKADLVDDAQEQSATVSSTPTTIQPKFGKYEAGAMGFGRQAIPTALGLGATGLAAYLTGGTSLLAPLVAGLGTGFVASKGQDAALEKLAPNVLANLNQAQQEHPTATTIGGIAASAPFLKPTLKTLPGAGRVIRDVTTGVTPHASDVGNLANVAIGATLPPVIRKTFDPDVSAKDLILESLGGALFSDPRKYTTKLGKFSLHPNVYRDDIFANARDAQRPGAEDVETAKKPVDIEQQTIEAKNEASRLKELNEAETKSQEEAKKLAEVYKEEDKVVASHFGVSEKEFNKASNEAKAKLRNEYKDQLEKVRLENEKTKIPREDISKELQDRALAAETIQNAPEKVNTPAAELPIIGETTKLPSKEIVSETEGTIKERGEKKYSEEEGESKLAEISGKRQEPLISGAAKEGLSLKPTNRLFRMFQRLGIIRNIDVQKGTVTKADGTIVKGEMFPREGLETAIAKIGPEATIDTVPHEIFEGFRQDMLDHGSDAQKKLVTKGDRAVEKSPEYLEWKAAREVEKKNSSVREWYTTHTGEDGIRRVLRTDGDGKFKSFLKDFWANVKVKYGNAESKDFVRLMSNKLINDAPFHETFGKISPLNVRATIIESKYSEEGIPNKDKTLFQKEFENLEKRQRFIADHRQDLITEFHKRVEDGIWSGGPETVLGKKLRPEDQKLLDDIDASTREYRKLLNQIQQSEGPENIAYNAENEGNLPKGYINKKDLIKDKQELKNQFEKIKKNTEDIYH